MLLLVELLKFVLQYISTASQVVRYKFYFSVDTARCSPPTLFQFPKRPEDQQVYLAFGAGNYLFVGGGEVPWGQSGILQSGTVLLFLWLIREVYFLLVCDVSFVLQT